MARHPAFPADARQSAAQYLRDVREADPIYASEGLAHPGLLLRLCNLALRENVVLQPWIHTGSKVTNFAAARVGDELSARARVAANYDRKGHRMVDLDVALIANEPHRHRPRAAHRRLPAAAAVGEIGGTILTRHPGSRCLAETIRDPAMRLSVIWIPDSLG